MKRNPCKQTPFNSLKGNWHSSLFSINEYISSIADKIVIIFMSTKLASCSRLHERHQTIRIVLSFCSDHVMFINNPSCNWFWVLKVKRRNLVNLTFFFVYFFLTCHRKQYLANADSLVRNSLRGRLENVLDSSHLHFGYHNAKVFSWHVTWIVTELGLCK